VSCSSRSEMRLLDVTGSGRPVSIRGAFAYGFVRPLLSDFSACAIALA
jgi:hypothetical protein